MLIRNSLLRRAGAVCLLVTICSGRAPAAVVLDTFEPGASATGPDWAVFGGTQAQALAVRFSLDRADIITSALLALDVVGEAKVGVLGDSAGLPSALFLYETSVADAPANLALGGLSWALPAGDYWLAAVIEDDAAYGLWTGGRDASTLWAYTSAPQAWSTAFDPAVPAARLETTAVPLPSPLLLLAGALPGLAPRRGRRPG